jgi:predicted XRE-type DNA-binding protein
MVSTVFDNNRSPGFRFNAISPKATVSGAGHALDKTLYLRRITEQVNRISERLKASIARARTATGQAPDVVDAFQWLARYIESTLADVVRSLESLSIAADTIDHGPIEAATQDGYQKRRITVGIVNSEQIVEQIFSDSGRFGSLLKFAAILEDLTDKIAIRSSKIAALMEHIEQNRFRQKQLDTVILQGVPSANTARDGYVTEEASQLERVRTAIEMAEMKLSDKQAQLQRLREALCALLASFRADPVIASHCEYAKSAIDHIRIAESTACRNILDEAQTAVMDVFDRTSYLQAQMARLRLTMRRLAPLFGVIVVMGCVCFLFGRSRARAAATAKHPFIVRYMSLDQRERIRSSWVTFHTTETINAELARLDGNVFGREVRRILMLMPPLFLTPEADGKFVLSINPQTIKELRMAFDEKAAINVKFGSFAAARKGVPLVSNGGSAVQQARQLLDGSDIRALCTNGKFVMTVSFVLPEGSKMDVSSEHESLTLKDTLTSLRVCR